MLFSPMGSSSPIRVQGAFVSDEEVSAISHHTANQQEANYDEKNNFLILNFPPCKLRIIIYQNYIHLSF